MARLTATVTQGGADAFAQAEMATALTGIKGTAYLINAIRYELILPAVPVFPLNVAALQDISLALTRRTKAAMPNISDVDVIHKWKYTGTWTTLVGSVAAFKAADVFEPKGEILVVEDPLFLQIDSTGSGAIWSAVVDVDYEVKKISDIDRLSLLTLSLG